MGSNFANALPRAYRGALRNLRRCAHFVRSARNSARRSQRMPPASSSPPWFTLVRRGTLVRTCGSLPKGAPSHRFPLGHVGSGVTIRTYRSPLYVGSPTYVHLYAWVPLPRDTSPTFPLFLPPMHVGSGENVG